MAIEKITKTIDLDLKGVPKSRHATVRREVGDFVKEEILRSLSEGNSPVQGESFASLSPKYADKQKGGNRTPNLELDGDLLDALIYRKSGDGIEIGIFQSSQVDKADGHNKFTRSNNNRIPKRRFIPKPSQNFDKDIRQGIKDIVNDFKVSSSPFFTVTTIEESEDRVEIEVSDLFGDDLLSSLIGGR